MIPSLFFKIIFLFLFLCMHVHAPVYLCVYYSVAQGGQKRTLDPLELKLQVVKSASDMGAGN